MSTFYALLALLIMVSAVTVPIILLFNTIFKHITHAPARICITILTTLWWIFFYIFFGIGWVLIFFIVLLLYRVINKRMPLSDIIK